MVTNMVALAEARAEPVAAKEPVSRPETDTEGAKEGEWESLGLLEALPETSGEVLKEGEGEEEVQAELEAVPVGLTVATDAEEEAVAAAETVLLMVGLRERELETVTEPEPEEELEPVEEPELVARGVLLSCGCTRARRMQHSSALSS